MLTATISIIVVAVLAYRSGRYIGAERYKKMIGAKEDKLLEPLNNPVNYIQGAFYPAPEDHRWEPDPTAKHTLRLNNLVLKRCIGNEKLCQIDLKLGDSTMSLVDIACDDFSKCKGEHDIYKYWWAVYKACLARHVEELAT